jgi:hypothetical protein
MVSYVVDLVATEDVLQLMINRHSIEIRLYGILRLDEPLHYYEYYEWSVEDSLNFSLGICS